MNASGAPPDAPVPPPGLLVLVSTPIGNLGDLSPRARQTLQGADLVCCEDTRRTRALLTYAGIRGKRLLSLHARNEGARVDEVVSRLSAGAVVALVSDAGTPVVSDPGARLVRAALDGGATVSAVPGPSAALTAVVVSGLPSARFCVEGFLARRGAERRRRLASLAVEERTSVIFEAPGRLAATLAELVEACGGSRAVVVARELTKRHEEVWRGSLAEAAEAFAAREVRGEVVVVLGPAPAAAPADDAQVAAALGRHRGTGASWRDATEAVAAELGLPRRLVYDRAIELRGARSAETDETGGMPG